jgi:hypothetical protein
MKFKHLLTILIIFHNCNITYQFPKLTLNDQFEKLNYIFDEDSLAILSPQIGGSTTNEKLTLGYCNAKEGTCKGKDKVVKEVHLDNHLKHKEKNSKSSYITIRIIYKDGSKKEIYKRILIPKWILIAFAVYLKSLTHVVNNLDTTIYLDYIDNWQSDTYILNNVKHQIWINEVHTRFKVLKENAKLVPALKNLRPVNKSKRLRTYNIYEIEHEKLTNITVQDTVNVYRTKQWSKIPSNNIYDIGLTFGFNDGTSFT